MRRLVLSMLLLALAPSGAASSTTLRSVPEAAGGESAWDGGDRFVAARWMRTGGHELHVLGTPSRAPLARLQPAPGRGGMESVALAASARWIAVRRSRHRYDRQGALADIATDVLVADWSGAVRSVDACTTPRQEIRAAAVAIEGDVMAWSDTGCVARAEVVVLDLATGARTSLPVPDDPAVGRQPMVDRVSVRGRWVAATVSSWDLRLAGRGAVHYVFDRLTGELRLRTEPVNLRRTALTGDGTLIACSPDQRLLAFSPASPAGEALPITMRCDNDVAERDGQVAFMSPAPPLEGLAYGADLYAVAADGSSPPRLLLERPASLIGFDGTRAAVLVYADCRGRQGFGVAGDPAAPPAPPHVCPLEIGQPLLVRRGRRPRLRVSCPLGCVFTVFAGVGGRIVTYRHRAVVRPGQRYVSLPRSPLRAWGRHRFADVSVDMSTRCCVRNLKRRVKLQVRR